MNLIAEIIGNFGIFHLRSLFVLCLLKMPEKWTQAIVPIISPLLEEKNYYCKKTGDYKIATKCHLPNKQPCLEFEYSNYNFMYTITQQFNMVCTRVYFMAISQFANSVGIFLGYAIGTNVWHLVSPRRIILSGIWAYSIAAILTGNAFNFGQHLIFRLVMGFVGALLSCSSHMICAEITTDEVRLQALVVLEGFLALGDIVLANFATYFDSWSELYTFIGFVTLGLYLLKDLIPEAPNWLLRLGKINEANNLVKEAAKSNERLELIPINLIEKLEELAIEYTNKNVKYSDLWKDEYTSKNLLLAHLVSTCFLICFIGLTQTTRAIPSPKFQISLIFISLAAFCGCILALFVCKNYNRKEKWSILALFNIVGGIICYFGLFMPRKIDTMNNYCAWIILLCVPKLCTTFGRCLLLASLTDFTESKFRKNFVFSNIVFSRLIACVNPILFFLLNNKQPLRLIMFYGSMELLGGVLIIFLRVPIMETEPNKNMRVRRSTPRMAMNTVGNNLLARSDKSVYDIKENSKESVIKESN